MADQELVPFSITGADGKVSEVMVPRTAVLEAVKDTHVAKDRIDTDLNRRVQAIVKNQGLKTVDEFLADDALVAQAAEKFGFVRKDADTASQQLRDALAKQRADVETKEITPLKKQLEERQERENALLARDLDRQLTIALRDVGCKKNLTKAAIAELRDQLAYDEDTAEFYAADANNQFILSTGPGKGTYKTVEELVNDWAEKADNADFLDKSGQGGPGVGAGKKSGRAGNGVVTLTPEQAGDGPTLRKALESVGNDWSKLNILKPKNDAF